uniref:DUF6598 domain-containing protein n=1 Tax=Oryza meridionalis TaxID=40149 RepID=A0A0E0CV09_9ORYZ
MADSSEQASMCTDGGGAAAGVAAEGQNLQVLVTNRKRELTLEGKALPVECSGRRRIDLEKNCSMIGSPFTKHTSDKNGDNNEMRDVDERCTMDVDNTRMRDVVDERDARDVELGDMAAGKELEQGHTASVKEKESDLIKVVEVLHMVRCREVTEYNHKLGRSVPTPFCFQNIALFDLDKESKLGRGPPAKSLTCSEYTWMLQSINILSVKVTESDVGYPIRVFGTVVARDEYDFRRARDDPQLITSPEDTLTLTGPNRALGAKNRVYFEFHLKVRVDGDVDKDFSKGVHAHRADACLIRPVTLWLRSCLSTVILVYSPDEIAIEACVAVNIQGVVSNFTGKITAWTTEDHENKIVLYDSKVAGTKTVLGVDGSVELTRRFVAVEVEDILVLNICVSVGEDETEFELYLGQNDEE